MKHILNIEKETIKNPKKKKTLAIHILKRTYKILTTLQ